MRIVSRGRRIGGASSVVLLLLACGPAVAPATYAGRNGDILFATSNDPGGARLRFWRVRPDGGGRHGVTAARYRALAGRAPHGALSAAPARAAGVTVRGPGHRSETVAASVGEVSTVAWSPDGKLLALTTLVDPVQSKRRSRLFLVRRDGSGLRRLLSAPAHRELEGVSFSPGGRQVTTAINAREDKSPARLVVVPRRGPARTIEYTAASEMIASVDWAPDGRRIVYSVTRTDPYPTLAERQHAGIFTVDPTGSSPRHLDSPGDFPEQGASWSPDGTRIVFLGGCGTPPTAYGVCTIRPDGTDRQAVALGTATPPSYVVGIPPVWLPASAH